MIRTITVTNHNRESLLLDLFKPEKSGLIIMNIDGLGPTKANIEMNEIATIDGGLFSSARQESRNIVFTLRMLPCPMIEDARQKTYKFFPLKKKISLVVQTDNRRVETEGYVESNVPNIFSKDEETQISIVCPDPNFYGIGDESTVFSGVQPRFEFPFSNESLTDNLIEFGHIMLDTRATLWYEGDSDTGILVTIHALNSADNITIWNNDTYEHITINTNRLAQIVGASFGKGDDIIISTVKGQKYVRALHNGQYYNIISAINKDADWFQLTNGANVFTFTAETGENNLLVTFSYRKAYGGI